MNLPSFIINCGGRRRSSDPVLLRLLRLLLPVGVRGQLPVVPPRLSLLLPLLGHLGTMRDDSDDVAVDVV